jgi:hypothetical protein
MILGGPIALFVITAKATNQPAVGPVGFGGWLLLLAILQTFAPLRTLASISDSADGYRQLLSSSVPNGSLMVYLEIGLLGCFTAFQIAVTVTMFQRRRSFPKLFFYQWITGMGAILLDWVLVSVLLDLPLDQVVGAGSLGQAIGGSIAAGIWVWYVTQSKRVQNTFVR